MCGISKTVALMKKIMKLFVFVAAAAMALASCQKNEIDTPAKKEVHFTINAGIQTKTTIADNGDGTYTPSWKNGDKIGVLFSKPSKDSKKDAEFTNSAEDGEVATFEGTYSFDVVNDETEVFGQLYAFYPSKAFNKVYTGGTVRLDLPAVQYPASASFDPACDLLVAKPCDYMAEATGEKVEVVVDDMYFARLMSVLRINLNSEFLSDETVVSVAFDADAEGLMLSGAMEVNLETGEFVKNNSNTDLSEVKAVYSEEDPIAVAGTNNSAYLVVAPVTIPAGTTLTFTIETENYDIVKTVSAPADMVMPAGNVAVINLNIKETDCTEKVADTSDYSGEWLIVNTGLTKAASKWANGNNLPAYDLTVEDGYVLESDGLADCKMLIEKTADGYTIQDASGKYLYAASSSSNHLKGKDAPAYWTIEEADGVYTLVSKAQETRNILRYNDNNKIFSCYSSGQLDVTLYPYEDVKADTTPRITLGSTSGQVGADETSFTFTYTVKNITGNVTAAVEDGATMTGVTASASNGTVTVNFSANAAAEEKTATIVLSYTGAEPQKFVLTQAGKAAVGESGWISTSFANLKAGDQVVIVSTKGNSIYAMSNDKGTGSAPVPVAVTYSNGKLSKEPAANTVWYVGVDGANRIFNTDEGGTKWLYCTATNNGVRVGTDANKLFSLDSSSGYLVNNGTSRFLGVYNNQDWRCYTSVNNNIKDQTFEFFVKTGDSTGGGDVTPDPEPEPEPEPTDTKTATITFNSTNVKISSASVTGTDSQNNSWTITTAGTSSFTSNSAYYQVGSSKAPASTITFTTTLPATASVSKVSAKFGGFSGTTGNIEMKVGDTTVGSGKLSATSDVEVTSTSVASGNKVTVTITGIAKGVKCYYISVDYTE